MKKQAKTELISQSVSGCSLAITVFLLQCLVALLQHFHQFRNAMELVGHVRVKERPMVISVVLVAVSVGMVS